MKTPQEHKVAWDKSMKKQEKARIKQAKKDGVVFLSYPGYGVTLVLKRVGKDFGVISWAVCSDKDTFKKHTGKHIALAHMSGDHFLPVRWNEGWGGQKMYMRACLARLAQTISPSPNN